jgi:predicted nuclease of predicted toxin-antitoxin system
MTGFLLDENLPQPLKFVPSLPVIHVRDLGSSLSDSVVWEYAKTHQLVIVTKDSDFSERIMISRPPPRIVHLRLGNMRLTAFHTFLEGVWNNVEFLLQTHKLVVIFEDRLEGARDDYPED